MVLALSTVWFLISGRDARMLSKIFGDYIRQPCGAGVGPGWGGNVAWGRKVCNSMNQIKRKKKIKVHKLIQHNNC